MSNRLTHAKTDSKELWFDEESGVYLGYEPMWTDDGKIGVAFNGVIYNNRDLCEALTTRGHIFQTSYSNTEMLLHAYREWGEHTAEHLDGMWAFAIYDKERNRLILSRDRFGKKTLFYTFRSGTFIFSSELISLLSHPMSRCSLSILSLKKYFAYGFIPSPNSMYESVYKLQAGHNLVYDIKDKKCFVDKYWEFKLEPFETTPQEPEKVWGEQLCDLLNKAVKKRMLSDDSPGVFLSGGIDSTSVAYFASKYTSPLKTISIGFEEPSFDESRYSKFAAGIINSTHFHSMFLFDIAREMLDEIIDGLIEPIGDSSLISTYLLCKEARKHMTIALGGDGADELFAGYDPIKALRTAEVYSKLLPHPVHKAISMFVSRLPVSHSNMSLDFKLKRTLRGISYDRKLWNPVWLGPLDPAGVEKLFGEKTDLEELYSEAIDCWDKCELENPIDKTLQFYTQLYLQDDILVKVDRAGMMNSLEVRAPYLDIALVDFVRKIPSSYKYRNGQTKYILKKALEPILPREILYRRKKGFGVPIGKCFQQGELRINEEIAIGGLNEQFVKDQIADHIDSRSDNRGFLWNIYVLEKLLKRSIPN